MFLSMLLLTGCNSKHTPQVAYEIGAEHNFGTVKVKLDNDENQERFILYYTITNSGNESHFFSFIFTNDEVCLNNSNQFEYSDNTGSKIEFDETGYYTFYTSRVFYISYKNADLNIKNFIYEKYCNVEIPLGTFYFKNR